MLGLVKAAEGECEGRKDGPGVEAPDCVATVVKGLKVTVRCGRGTVVADERDVGADAAVDVLEFELCCGSRGEDSLAVFAMMRFRMRSGH